MEEGKVSVEREDEKSSRDLHLKLTYVLLTVESLVQQRKLTEAISMTSRRGEPTEDRAEKEKSRK